MMNKIRTELEKMQGRSAWDKGVTLYAYELVDKLEELVAGGYFDINNITSSKELKKALLNGAENWAQFSWGGSSLIYNYEIAERLCTPSELKRTRNGERRPNSWEEWLDTQARALYQAAIKVIQAVRRAVK